MDENFYFLVLAIPATYAFWFLYAIIVTELANWSMRRRIRTRKAESSPVSATVEPPKTQKQPVRGFDSPDLFREDLLKRIQHLAKEIIHRTSNPHFSQGDYIEGASPDNTFTYDDPGRLALLPW